MIRGPFQPEQTFEVVPTGAGVARPLAMGDLEPILSEGAWVPASDPGSPEGIIIYARRNQEAVRLYYVPLDGSAPRAVTPADLPLASQFPTVSGDGRNVAVVTAEGVPVEFGMDGSGPRVLSGTRPGDLPLRYHRDGIHLFVQASGAIPLQLYRVNLQTGERTLWRELSPGDPAGVVSVDRVQMSDDGLVQVYSHRRHTAALEILEGLE